MTDIVTRLRETGGLDASLHKQAADEIERLRSECTRLAQRNTMLVIEIDEARAVRDALYKGQG